MKVLVLGGTAFLGRHVVAEALTRGYHVTTFNRGQSGPDADGVEALHGDRMSRDDLEQLRSRTYDAVVDTSGFDPRTVRRAGRHLGLVSIRDRAGGVGGGLTVESVPGKGTTIEMEVPGG